MEKTDIQVIDGFNCQGYVNEVVVKSSQIQVMLDRKVKCLYKPDFEKILEIVDGRYFSIDLINRSIIIQREDCSCDCEDCPIHPEDNTTETETK